MRTLITIFVLTIYTSISAQIYTQGDGVTDIDGNFYTSIKINGQEWMQENLKVSKFQNGDAINYVTDSAEWTDTKADAYCYYNNDVSNKNVFGALYNGTTFIDSRGLCPTGWSIPTESDWDTLITFLGGRTIAGDKMKSTGNINDSTGDWNGGNNSTNESGMTILPAGIRHGYGSGFLFLSEMAVVRFNASTGMSFDPYGPNVSYTSGQTNMGTSVRCLKTIKTGIKNYNQNNLPIFPNPAIDFIIIGDSDVNYTLTSCNGEIISKGRTNQIDISNLSNGVYFITVNGTTSKFIKE